MDGPPPWRATAAAFAAAVESGRLDLPLPGGGRTRERWARLAGLACPRLTALCGVLTQIAAAAHARECPTGET